MRRRKAEERTFAPDARDGSSLVTHLTNKIMSRGKKSTAQRTVYGALDQLKEQTGEEPLDVFQKALDNVKPKVEVKSRRIGGATYQVPVEVPAERQTALALRWILDYNTSTPPGSLGRVPLLLLSVSLPEVANQKCSQTGALASGGAMNFGV